MSFKCSNFDCKLKNEEKNFYYVLECGHIFCKKCTDEVLKNYTNKDILSTKCKECN